MAKKSSWDKKWGKLTLADKEVDNKQLSRFLSLILRHHPEYIGVTLDKDGWTDTENLIIQANKHGKHFDKQQLIQMVAENDKQRFELSDTQIRAVQGHSHVSVQRDYVPITPPQVLYHGTAERFLSSIKEQGLTAQSRHHVHLSADYETAVKVGKRHGKPVVLTIDSQAMHQAGIPFFQAENGVWLVERVDVGFIGF